MKKHINKIIAASITAMYSKNGLEIGFLDRGDLWQIATKKWDRNVEDLFTDCMTILVARDAADTGQFLINNVFEYDGVHSQGPLKAFINNDMLVVHITKS